MAPTTETITETITVRAPKGGRRRAGRRWPEGETTVEAVSLSHGQLDELKADPALVVTRGAQLIGEAQAGAEPPVGTAERKEPTAALPAEPVPAPVPALQPAEPGTLQAVSGAPAPAGDALEDHVEAAIRALDADGFGRDGTPKLEAIRAGLGTAERAAITAELRDRVWAAMTGAGFRAPEAG